MFEILIAISLGVLAGTITGLTPGLHINLVALLLFIFSSFFLNFTSSLMLSCFIVSMSVTHCFLDFIPSIFLGVPKENTALSILPGHKMLLKGEGYGAIKLTTMGCLLGTVIACVFAFFFSIMVEQFYLYLRKFIGIILITISFFLIVNEKKKTEALFIFIISGVFGMATLNFTLIKQPLFPLFTSLFGSSLLLMSFLYSVSIPKQKIKEVKIKRKEIGTCIWASILSSSLVSFLPGVGAACAATVSATLKKISDKAFLFLLGMISTMTTLLSFVSLYAIEKPRTGVAVFVGKLIPELTKTHLIYFMIVALIASLISFFLSSVFAKIFSKNIEKINYKWLSLGILIFLIVLTPIISGWFALLVMLIGTCLGILSTLLGVKKIYLMGSLMIPVILWYLL